MNNMTLSGYQLLAERTINGDLGVSDIKLHALHGLAGEVGEIHSLFQKKYQGHEFDISELKKEMGDLLWFVAELATACDMELGDIAEANIEKLKKRYPDGFDVDRSVNREQYEG